MKINLFREGIELDTSKIVAAVMRAVDLFAGISEMVEEIIESVERTLTTFAHTVAHILHGCYTTVKRKVKTFSAYGPSIAAVLVSTFSAYVKNLTLAFLEFACKSRKALLLRVQDRSGDIDDDGSHTIFSYIAA